ncbi:MAG: methyltransferase, partial [Bacteroidales bacterium]|nr:methyltransferase [Bacteroidales bacterium]
MTSKELIQQALLHRETNQIPVDFGATSVTGIHVKVVEQLRTYFGLEKKPVKVSEPYQMLGEFDEELARIMGIDTVGLTPRNNMFGFPNENWKEFLTPWGQIVLVPEKFITTSDQDGALLMYPEGDRNAPPSARMPRDSFFFDTIVRQEPFREEELTPEANLEEFGFITNEELNYWKKQIEKIAGTDKAVVANFGGTALGDIALVPAPFMKYPKGIRDITEWYMSTIMRQDLVRAIFDRQTEIAVENLKRIHAIAGNAIDVVFLCGTDFGTQDSQFCDVDTFRSLWLPYYKRMNDWIHQNTRWKTFKHSCGSVRPLIRSFIDAGFDILNPVQINAAGM